MTEVRTQGKFSRPLFVAMAAALCCCLNLLILWPGSLTPDSKTQLSQALARSYTDWHPPFMAMLWRLIGPVPATMFILQIAIHWLGIWAFAEQVRRTRSTHWLWAVLAVGLTPIALKYTGVIQKDSLLTSFLILAFGLSFLTSKTALALPFGLAAILCRANGIFALPPLIFSLRKKQTRIPVMIAISIAASVILVPVIGMFNTRILGAEASGVQRSVQLFDMAGVAHFSKDLSGLPAGAEKAADCYTPLFWDALGPCMAPMNDLKKSLTKEWLAAIVRHPVAYAQHRVSHFNRTIFFLVPPMQQCVDAPAFHQCDFSARGKLRDIVQKNALLWPITWLAVGVLLLFGTMTPISKTLTVSGLLYGFAYIVVGVAADFRYFYWTEIAIQLAMVLQLALVGRIDRWKYVLAGAAVVWAMGYGARMILS